MAESERLSLDDVVAIDVHAHVEMSEAGVDSLPDELRDAAVQPLPRRVGAADGGRARARTTASGGMMAVVFTVDAESVTGQAARAERGDRRGRERRTPTS